VTPGEREALRSVFSGSLPAARDLQRRLWHRVPATAWLVLRDFARYWRNPAVQQIVAEVLSAEVALGLERLHLHRRPALVLWGESDRPQWARPRRGPPRLQLLLAAIAERAETL
jgi:hypothetical protein